MQPWQQQGYGYNSSFQGGGGMQNQQTGQQGMNQQPSFMSSQPTGFNQQRPGGNLSFLNAPPPSGSFGQQNTGSNFGMQSQPTGMGGFGGRGMAPQMTGFPGGGASGLLPQQTGFGGGMMSQTTGYGGGGLMSQPTGFGLRAQPTGYQDPRLATMMQSFMPSNMSQPFAASGAPQFNSTPQNQPLTHTFQTLLQNPQVKTPKVPWTLSKQEKKDYDQIFRAWEKGDGFVSGETAREVFGQSGLGQDDLIKIWTLSDVSNRGKLNLAEFHVAMGLIYRALNGNEIPDKLPEEMVPPSMRDIDTTVNFMRDLLKHEASTRSNTSSPSYGASTPLGPQSKDATAYKHDDSRSSSTYKPSSRHLDRKSVRYAGEESGADIGDLRRQLQNTSAMLDKSNADYERKSEEDERLEQEVEDLKYRVKRLQEDIDYVSKGRRTAEKDEERRKLERELLYLMHEKLPELERRQQQREDERKMEERAGVRARDRRNDTHGRYDDRDDRDDHSWLKGSYDRDRRGSRDRDYYRRDDRDDRRRDDRDDYRRDDRDYRERDRSRERDRDYRPRSPPRSPPPAPPAAPTTSAPAAPPAPPKTAASVPNTKNMTPEERTAFIREQAQKRIQDRLRALGVESAPTETAVVDKTVEERLAQEKKEAEEKSRTADEEQKAREQARQARLAGTSTPAPEEKKETPKSPEPKSILKGKSGPPPPPAPRGKAPPAPASRIPPAPAAPTPAAPAEEDPEEVELRKREEAIQKAKEERRRRLAELEREEEEERKREEEARKPRAAAAPEAPATASPPPPPAPPAPTSGAGGYNPFRKPGGGASVTSPPAPAAPSAGGFNPFFKPQAAASPASSSVTSPSVTSPPAAPPAPPAPAPPAAPAPPPAPRAPAAPIQSRCPAPPADDGWESIHEKEADSDDSSDDEDYATSRNKRQNLASALFGGLTGGSSSPITSRPGSAAPKAPPAALQKLGGGDPNAGRGALLNAIQGGARLKKTQTVVKGEPVSGKVIGDAAPPPHISDAPRDHSDVQRSEPVDEDDGFTLKSALRQSVDWYAGLAADQAHPTHSFESGLEKTPEEPAHVSEAVEANGHDKVEEAAQGDDDLAEFDLSTSLRVRTLYPYEGQRDADLTFKENVIIVAHPAKDSSSPWWYGMVVDGGAKGWFPHEYVAETENIRAKALYSYGGSTPEELPFAEGDELTIIENKEDADWWKTEKAGVVFLVPASYLEVIDKNHIAAGEDIDKHRELPSSGSVSKLEPALGANRFPEILADSDPLSQSSTTELNPLSPGLLSPGLPLAQAPSRTPNRPRASTMASYTSSVGDGDDSSSEDSVLSWWSDDESDDETAPSEVPTEGMAENEARESEKDKEEKEKERKRREEERLQILNAAGLQLRREPPGIPSSTNRKVSRRRAPPTPGQSRTKKDRRKAPDVPASKRASIVIEAEEKEADRPIETQDAYARYEQFLAESRAAPAVSVSPPVTSSTATTVTTVTSPTLAVQRPGSTVRDGRDSGTSTPHAGGGRLSGLFSRMKTPAPERKGPTISGPITRVEEPRELGTATPASAGIAGEVGKTWSSLVEPDVLASISDGERKRQEAIYEFIQTEGSYNRDLQLIVQIFYTSLLDTLDEKAQKVIFANVEDLLLLNTAFLSDLEERQRESRLWVDRIGDVFCAHMVNMDGYMPYCVNQSQAGQLLQSLRTSNPALQAQLESIKSTNPAVRGLDLSHFLLIPMQRITRYPLLLKQIIHYTDSDQDLPLLQESLDVVERIVGRINEKVRENENRDRLRVLSEELWIGGEGRLDLTVDTAYQGPRQLLKEGVVHKSKSGRKLTLVLCNDILVLIDSKNLYRMPIPLFECTVRKGRDETTFVLKVEYRRGSDSISLKAPSPKEAKEWRYLIEEARLASVDARMTSGTGGMPGFYPSFKEDGRGR